MVSHLHAPAVPCPIDPGRWPSAAGAYHALSRATPPSHSHLAEQGGTCCATAVGKRERSQVGERDVKGLPPQTGARWARSPGRPVRFMQLKFDAMEGRRWHRRRIARLLVEWDVPWGSSRRSWEMAMMVGASSSII
ncbi:hypothetical protein CMUS01_12528 [Colletotrichum musicola]|uniref:Uncharacterized protein n=1 Tax=Colletotrichum musicola TaxID=2175873 RepID=A0A8H6JLY8_9PEZI|nr:hypothetical protein CMUS01_12528 [Colletotrichum musicola]